jgi:two-component system, OmpR family, heavy metal sensor histidine kinase CusS
MFLKNVKRYFQKRISITAYLTIFYALSTFTLLAIMAFFLYGEMVDLLHQNNQQVLSDEINIVYNIIKSQDKNHTLKHEVQDVPPMIQNSIYHYSIRVVDSTGKTILETPGMEKRFGQVAFLQEPAKEEKEQSYWHGPHGKKYLLMKIAVKPTPDSPEFWQIQAAMNVSFQHTWITARRHLMMIILYTSDIIAVFFGYFITRRGLRRLYELTKTTKKITVKSLHQRIDAQSWPKELRKLGGAFNGMLNRIENAFSNLTQFSADLAHELRTPINNMLGETEIALSNNQDNKELAPLLISNIEELHRLSKIIENILFLAHAENPQLELKKQDLLLADEVNLICEYYQPLADDKNITITVNGAATVNANQVMIRRALSNLLSNALKYSPPDSSITFNIETVDPQTVVVSVSDSGIGIAPEHLPNMFNRFYRVTTTHADQPGGNGLGLAIVKSIMKLHRGTSAITSIPGVGTTVTLSFAK